jgi:carboxymethylenebutenolidase
MATARVEADLTPAQRAMVETWERHTRSEFVDHDADAAVGTMSATPHLIHVPVLTGGVGREAIRTFYATHFIPEMPPDAEIELLSRTVGHDRIVDEFILKFTHTVAMGWFVGGVAPTGKRVEIPKVAVIQFRDGKIESEHIFWDQASVLVQLGLLDPGKLPVVGVETAERMRDSARPRRG